MLDRLKASLLGGVAAGKGVSEMYGLRGWEFRGTLAGAVTRLLRRHDLFLVKAGAQFLDPNCPLSRLRTTDHEPESLVHCSLLTNRRTSAFVVRPLGRCLKRAKAR